MTDPSAIVARASAWAAELQQRGQIDDAAAERLSEVLAASLGEGLDRPDDPLLVVMLCGPTAVGKSSLINALAGADISGPGLGATTGAPVFYVHERDDAASLFEYSVLLADGEDRESVVVRHHRDELLHKVLVDTPDIDSFVLRHRQLTAKFVHAADLVLFVTSPEKYKVMRSARWVLEQRQQRGMAFVLNKWDRQALGLQQDRREEIATDFRHVLANEGLPDALVFKVSALAAPRLGAPSFGAGEIENELPALRAWLETGISQSTTAMIRQRRLRAAWGRLAAAIQDATPAMLSSHPLLPALVERLGASGDAAQRRVAAEAALLEAAGLEDQGWPSTPGLLGMWARTRQRIGSTAASLRSGLSMFDAGPQRAARPEQRDGFAASAVAMVSETMTQLATEAVVGRLPLGPIAEGWTQAARRLERQAALLPLDAATELVASANKPGVRRFLGIASIYAMETLIVLVLLVALGRAGIDFVQGSYAPPGLFLTVLEIVATLLVVGSVVANMFFPPLRQRLRRMTAQRGKSLFGAFVNSALGGLRDHVQAVDRLSEEGRALSRLIERTVAGLGNVEDAGVDRLFGAQQPSTPSLPMSLAPVDVEPARRRPTFD